MVAIGELVARVRAETQEFDRPLRESAGEVSALDQVVERFGNVGAVALASGFAAVATTVVQASNALRSYHRELSLGAGIAGLSNREYEAISRTFGAFGLQGDAAADILNDLTERLRDAQEGTESYAAAFERLGIDIDTFASRSRSDQLLVFARALERVDDGAAQLSANELAGDQGQRLLSVIRQIGSQRFAELIEDFEALDATTEEYTQSLLEADIAIAQFRAGFQEAFERGTALLTEFLTVGLRLREISDGVQNLEGGLSEAAERRVAASENLNVTYQGELDSLVRIGEAAQAAYGPAVQSNLEAVESSSRTRIEFLDMEIERLREARQESAARNREELEALRARERARIQNEELILRSLSAGTTPIAEEIAATIDARINILPFEIPPPPPEVAERFELSNQQMLLLGSTINTVIGAAISGFEDVGDVALAVFQQVLNFGLGNLSSGLGFFGGARQSGGPVDPGRSFLVGERGPELFVPPTGGNIAPTGALRGGDTFIIEAGVNAQQVSAIVRSLLPSAQVEIRSNFIRSLQQPNSPEARAVRGVR